MDKEQVLKYYNEYQILFPDINYPELQIEFKRQPSYATVLDDDLYNRKYILYLGVVLNSCNEQFQKSVLFHEFTHIYDSVKYRYIDDYEEYSRFLSDYSEIHASYVQTQFLTSCFQNEVIHSYTLIEAPKESISFIRYVLNHKNKVCEVFCHPGRTIRSAFSDGLMQLSYFIGEKVFAEKYMSDYKRAWFEFDSIFKDDIIGIENAYKNDPRLISGYVDNIISKYEDIRG